MFKLSRGERGQSIIVIALIMVVLIALIALVIDIGRAYAERRNFQNAADAAALGGTLEYVRMFTYDRKNPQGEKPPTFSSIRQKAKYIVFDDGHYNLPEDTEYYIDFVWSDGHRSSVPEGEGCYDWDNLKGGKDVPTGVQVMVGRQFSTYFAGVIGHGLLQASAVAREKVELGIKEADEVCLFPVVVHEEILTKTPDLYGSKYCFWDGPQANCPEGYIRIPEEPEDKKGQGGGADHTAPGNWGWIGWGKNDVPTLRDYILNGRCGSWEEDDFIEGGPGIMSALDDEVRLRKKKDPYIVIPVYDYLEEKETGKAQPKGGSNARYHTIKLVTFHLEAVNMQGNNKYIAGTFVGMYVPCEGCSSSGEKIGPIIIGPKLPVE